MRRAACALALLLGCALPAAPAPEARESVQAVEFPYYLSPRPSWERELVTLKAMGVRTVAFAIPWNWHQVGADDFDFAGRSNPRRDLTGLIRLLRRLGLRAWVRPFPPLADWPREGWPSGADVRSRETWTAALENLLGTQTASHGGPIAFLERPAEGRAPAIDAPAPPAAVTRISAIDAAALPKSRAALANPEGALLWTDAVDALYPAGWSPRPGETFRAGAISFAGEERAQAAALRRGLALLRHWKTLLPALQPATMPRPLAGKFPDGVTAVEFTSQAASAVSVTNTGSEPFHDDLRVVEPSTRKTVAIPGVTVAPGESLWLPIEVSLSPAALCHECSAFSRAETVLYATAELTSIEFENGTLGLEFAAPAPAIAVLQLARKPVGPYLAAGRPTPFEWDDQTLRARLPIPAGTGAGNRVHVVLAIELPRTAAFFNDAKRLIIGRKNTVSTAYSSDDVAARSRLLIPEGFTAKPATKSPGEIAYEIAVPAEAVAGDTVNFGIEVDGILLGRAFPQLLPPAAIRLPGALALHVGPHAWTSDPAVVVVEPKGGTEVDVAIRNNWPGIQTFRIDAAGQGLDFFPAKTEIAVGAMAERHLSMRVFAAADAGVAAGLRDWTLRVTGAADFALPLHALLAPRGRTVVWSADLNGDGFPEWVIESPHARAVFSPADGGRWTEFTWKDTDANFLGERGAFATSEPVDAASSGDTLEFAGPGWKRSIRLSDATLTIEQTTALPGDGPEAAKRGNVTLTVEHPSERRAVYTLR